MQKRVKAVTTEFNWFLKSLPHRLVQSFCDKLRVNYTPIIVRVKNIPLTDLKVNFLGWYSFEELENMVATKMIVLIAVFMVLSLADDSKSIDGGFHYDYGKDRNVTVTQEKENVTQPVRFIIKKRKRTKPQVLDGLPVYRDWNETKFISAFFQSFTSDTQSWTRLVYQRAIFANVNKLCNFIM